VPRDPRRRWRDESGPGWRWWSDDMMVAGACAPSLSSVKADGVCMDVLARMAAACDRRVREQVAQARLAERNLQHNREVLRRPSPASPKQQRAAMLQSPAHRTGDAERVESLLQGVDHVLRHRAKASRNPPEATFRVGPRRFAVRLRRGGDGKDVVRVFVDGEQKAQYTLQHREGSQTVRTQLLRALHAKQIKVG